jgi:hypothetical protein
MTDDDDQLPPEFRDLSYERTRSRQMYDLLKDSLIDFGWPEKLESPHDPTTWPKDRLELYVKQRARGAGYVADFVYTSRDLPVRVYGILINRGKGLEVAELELFRLDWGYEDGQADDPDDEPVPEPESLITSDLLRKIPLGTIVARAQATLAQEDWRDEGVTQLGLTGPRDIPTENLLPTELAALEHAAASATSMTRGRPSLPDDLLAEVAHRYLREAAAGPGLTRRLSAHFDRPEPTIRDWISAARRRGFLSEATPGRRAAAPGPMLEQHETSTK